MNPNLEKLHAYPFARLGGLLSDIKPEQPPLSLALGEPQHRAPDFLVRAMQEEPTLREGFGRYPATEGTIGLRNAISTFIAQRFTPARCDPEHHILPVNGTREALFSVAQALADPSERPLAIIPNPFYQIYEGAALLAGLDVLYLNESSNNQWKAAPQEIDAQTLKHVGFIYLCNPGNPHGRVLGEQDLRAWIDLSQSHRIPIICDECYSEIYEHETDPPPGLLTVAAQLGLTDFSLCLVFNSLSKRSNLPGLRSGFVAGDPELIEAFRLYRTYHGSAMALHTQSISTLAWQDEGHVIENRALYRKKFETFLSTVETVWPMQRPPASFFLFPEIPVIRGLKRQDDEAFTRWLFKHAGIRVLPGSYLSRDAEGVNPGAGHVRIALVEAEAQVEIAARRIVQAIAEFS